jgi:hypothetical protein
VKKRKESRSAAAKMSEEEKEQGSPQRPHLK